MNLTKTSLVIPLVAVLLVGAAGAVLATSGGPAAPEAPAPAAETPSPAPSAATKAGKVVGDDVLAGVLDDLVADGTITEAQQKAILDGVAAERTARREARQAAREQAKADRQQLKGFLADGVITKAEFDQLPADSPMRTLTTLMDDGKITADELKELGRSMFGKRGNGWGGWGGWGKGDRGAGPQPSASPSTGG